MGYFEGLVSRYFKTDKNGKTLFFPWGMFGKGRVLPDAATEARLRDYLRRYYQISVPVVIGLGVFVNWAWSLLLVPLMYVALYFGTRGMIAGLPYGEEAMTLTETWRNAAKAYKPSLLWTFLVGSLLFVLGGVFLIVNATSPQQMMLGIASVGFFGAGGVVAGYMLGVRRGG